MRAIEALIARHQEAQKTFHDTCEKDPSDATMLPLSRAAADTVNAILDHRPSTIDEARRQCGYLLELWERGEDDFGKPEIRRLLQALAA